MVYLDHLCELYQSDMLVLLSVPADNIRSLMYLLQHSDLPFIASLCMQVGNGLSSSSEVVL